MSLVPRSSVVLTVKSDSRVAASPIGQDSYDGSFVFVDIDILQCSRFASRGVETPSAPHPALCCPVAMSAASASSAMEKGEGQT